MRDGDVSRVSSFCALLICPRSSDKTRGISRADRLDRLCNYSEMKKKKHQPQQVALFTHASRANTTSVFALSSPDQFHLIIYLPPLAILANFSFIKRAGVSKLTGRLVISKFEREETCWALIR